MIQERSTSGADSDILFRAADRFKPGGRVSAIREYGNGNVNKTFKVRLEPATESCFILQRLNRRIFLRPGLIMQNLRTLTRHIQERLKEFPLAPGRRWETPLILPTRDGEDQWIAPDGSFWRAMTFISDAISLDTVQDREHAREVGYGLGTFHSLLSDLPARKLGDTLEGFHVTPLYLAHYDRVLAGAAPGMASRADTGLGRAPVARKQSVASTVGREMPCRSEPGDTVAAMRPAIPRDERAARPHFSWPGMSAAPVRYCVKFIEKHRPHASVLEDARTSGKLFLRPVHGDPKSNNIMMDIRTHRAVAFVDLDTVKPGLIQYDIGDCLRSCCNPLGEETEDWEAVRFETDYCGEILRGYLSVAEGFLTPLDREYFFDATRLIAFELGLRFFTDYLEGNVYFKVGHPEQNLFRALVQFRLAESIESRERSIRALSREKP